MTDEPRRSRLAWPKAPEPPEGCPHVAPKKAPLFIAYACIAMLTVAVAGIMIYLLSKSAQRDKQIEDTNQQIRTAICQLLDGLPDGGVLDVSRAQFHCGPGTPIEQFPPSVRDQLNGTPSMSATPEPAPETPEPLAPYVPPLPMSTDGAQPRPTASSPTTAPASPTSLLDTICDAVGVCVTP